MVSKSDVAIYGHLAHTSIDCEQKTLSFYVLSLKVVMALMNLGLNETVYCFDNFSLTVQTPRISINFYVTVDEKRIENRASEEVQQHDMDLATKFFMRF